MKKRSKSRLLPLAALIVLPCAALSGCGGCNDKSDREYCVVFEMQGHGQQIADSVTTNSGVVWHPANPSESGFEFRGWYEDSACTKRFDFSNPVRNDVVLYARWVELPAGSSDGTEPTPPQGGGQEEGPQQGTDNGGSVDGEVQNEPDEDNQQEQPGDDNPEEKPDEGNRQEQPEDKDPIEQPNDNDPPERPDGNNSQEQPNEGDPEEKPDEGNRQEQPEEKDPTEQPDDNEPPEQPDEDNPQEQPNESNPEENPDGDDSEEPPPFENPTVSDEQYAQTVRADLLTEYKKYVDIDGGTGEVTSKNYSRNLRQLTAIYQTGLGGIAAAESREDVLNAYRLAVIAFEGVKSDAQFAAEELAALKEQAILSLEAYVSADYGRVSENYEVNLKIAQAKYDGYQAINAATSAEEVALALANGKGEVDGVVNAQLLSVEQARTAAARRIDEYALQLLNTFDRADRQIITLINAEAERQKALIDSCNADSAQAVYDLIELEAFNAIAAERRAERFTVTYVGGVEETASFNYGCRPEMPAAPYREGCRFTGWFTDEPTTKPYDFSTSPVVYGDMILYAGWRQPDRTIVAYAEDRLYNLSYYSEDGFDGISLPEIYPSAKYVEGWYCDPSFTRPFGSTTELYDGMSVYAHYLYKSDEMLSYGSEELSGEDMQGLVWSGKLFSLSADCVGGSAAYDGGVSADFLTDGGATVANGAISCTRGCTLRIIAKEDVELCLYVALGGTNQGEGAVGEIVCAKSGGESALLTNKVPATQCRAVRLSLSAGEKIVIYLGDGASDSARLRLFGIEAKISADFINTLVIFNKTDGEETVGWSTLKADGLEALAGRRTDRGQEGTAFVGWSLTEGGAAVENWHTVELCAGGTLNLYPVFREAAATVIYHLPEVDDVLSFTEEGIAVPVGVTQPFTAGAAAAYVGELLGYQFECWCTDGECNNEYSFGSYLGDGEELHLYAKYVKLPEKSSGATLSFKKSGSKGVVNQTDPDGLVTLSGSLKFVTGRGDVRVGGVTYTDAIEINKSTELKIAVTADVEVKLYCLATNFSAVLVDGLPVEVSGSVGDESDLYNLITFTVKPPAGEESASFTIKWGATQYVYLMQFTQIK